MFAWQAKLVLDGEPDEQRRLGRLGVDPVSAEVLAGLFAGIRAIEERDATRLAETLSTR